MELTLCEEIYEYQLEPFTQKAGKDTNIFNDSKTVPPSFDNRILLLGEFAYSADLKVVAAELNARGWYCCDEFNENYVRYLRGMENIRQPSPDLRQCRYLIVGEKTPMSGELIRHALRQQKKEKFLIIRERDFFTIGAFQLPKYDPITSLADKNVAKTDSTLSKKCGYLRTAAYGCV